MDVGLAMTARVNPNERERPLTEVYRQIIDQAVPGKERFGRTYEALEVIRKCFSEEEFSHDGKYFHYDRVRMTTKPVQSGGPPIYMAAMGPQSLTRTGTEGYNLCSALHTPLVHLFIEAQQRAGRTRADYSIISGPVAVHVAETRERAWDEAESALHWWVSFYRARGFDMPLPPLGELRNTPGAGIFGQPFAVGTPDDVLQAISKHRNEDIEEMVIQFNHPGMAAEHVRSSMELFARELMPEVSTWGTRAA